MVASNISAVAVTVDDLVVQESLNCRDDKRVFSSHPGFEDALVFVAPHDQVQKLGQVCLTDGVFGAAAVLQPILMQHENIEPRILRQLRRSCRPHPAKSIISTSEFPQLDLRVNVTWQ